jgi:hypothetical protein
MADWFAKLMQHGHARSRPAVAGDGPSKKEGPERLLEAGHDRYATIAETLREREMEDRPAREKRLAGYDQSVGSGSGLRSGAPGAAAPVRLYRFPTKVPCRVTPQARLLLDDLRKKYPGGIVTMQQLASGKQALVLTAAAGAEPKWIGRFEHCVETDPKLCNVLHQGLAVDTDGAGMLVLRFRYPATTARMSSGQDADAGPSRPALPSRPPTGDGPVPPDAGDRVEDFADAMDEAARVDFTEIRPALDMRAPDEGTPPRLVMLVARELEMMNAVGSRDFQAFYVRFKHEVLGGVWTALSRSLAHSPGSHCHRGSYYSVVREPDPAEGRIYQKTVDDCGGVVDIGLDRMYDASAATDIVVLYLAGDILADIADIYFTIQGLGSADTHFLKEEFFSVVRRFWSSAQGLASHYGSEHPAVVRMSLRAVPAPAQVTLLKEEWANLRQVLVDRYGEGGRHVSDLLDQHTYRPTSVPLTWPFASFPDGDINLGLRLVYRQEWRHLGDQRGDVVRTIPLAPNQVERVSSSVKRKTNGHSTGAVEEVARAVAGAMKWPLETEGSINMGVYGLAGRTDMGLRSECRESSLYASTRLSETMRMMAARIRSETRVVVSTDGEEGFEPSASTEIRNPTDDEAVTFVYSRLQKRYEVLTRLAEVENVVMVAEKLPTPAEIDFWWVKQHDWILAKVLLDESFRDALASISQDARSPDAGVSVSELQGVRDSTIEHLDTFAGKVSVRPDGIEMVGEWKRGSREIGREWQRAPQEPAREQLERLALDFEVDAMRDRLYEHLRANILHYQRAIWQQEDPQQRSMRYRKSGTKVPLEWRFEIQSRGAQTIDELGARLSAANVDGQFTAYSGGLEVDLDQVIDPAGPIGFHGNCAVYRMRPEFASEDLFSVLHFFKSPYLRPDPETGKPELADPALIQISEDPEVLALSDDAIERNREEIFVHVPAFRQELAAAWRKVSDGSDPNAVEDLKQRYGEMRHHYAEYLFRRGRSRRIVLDTDRLVTDVVRGDGSSLDGSLLGIEVIEAAGEKEEVAAEEEEGIEQAIVLRGDVASITVPTRGAGAGRAIVAPRVKTSLVAGSGTAPPAEQAITPRGAGGVITTPVSGAASGRLIVAEPESLVAGPGAAQPHRAESERMIVPRRDPGLTGLIAGATAIQASDPVTYPGARARRRYPAQN